VYLAAGCLETSRIISNSLGIKQFPIVENPMFHVPIIYTGRAKAKEFTELLALHNVLIGRLPGEEIDSYVHMQVYPLNLYLWNHALSKLMGNAGLSMSDFAQQTIGKHVYMMLFYFHGDLTRGSSVQFDGERMNLQFRYESGLNHQAKQVLRELSGVLQRSGFHVGTPFMSQLPPGGSYHYAGTVPAGGTDYADASLCELVKGVHVCDSASFPSLPAQNHSYTIMANAYRIADQSLT
jgi:choline dehydrogenase-like flavoprotein